jgi:hypothetical protein
LNALRGDEASALVNWVPEAGRLVLRQGWVVDQTPGGRLLTTHVWACGNCERVIYSKENGSFSLETIDNTASLGGLNGGNFRSVMMNDRLGLVNGVDQPIIYNGNPFPGSFSPMPMSGPADPSRLVGIKVFKSRSYFWDNEQLGFWYSQPNALGGNLLFFPLATVAQQGGRVHAVACWARDGGSGPTDFLVVLTTRGEVIVYQGSNPSDASDWALAGRYQIAPPVPGDTVLELDGKIHCLTINDFETLPDRFLRFDSAPSKVHQQIKENMALNGNRAGYKLFFSPERRQVIINMPVDVDNWHQLVMAQAGWTRFEGIPARDWAFANNKTYMALQGGRLGRLTGSRDNGQPITFRGDTGYALLRSNSEKRITAFRPQLRSPGSVTVRASLSFDLSSNYQPEQVQVMTATGTDWGAPWGSDWSGPDAGRLEWFTGVGSGQTVSMRIAGESIAPVEWLANDFEYVPGGMY